MKRLVYAVLAVLVFFQGGLQYAHAGSGFVGRAEFLQRAVESLYGDTSGVSLSAPFDGIPREAKSAVGIARVKDALGGWRNDWDAPASRGEAVKILFALSDLTPAAERTEKYRDIRSKTDRRMAAQAISWRLLQPISAKYFGWTRALRESDLAPLLDNFGAHLNLPLAFPDENNVHRGGRVRPRRGGTPGTGRREKTIKIKKGGITIKIVPAAIDRGSRAAGTKVLPTDLPRSDLLRSLWGIVKSNYLHMDRVDQNELAYKIAGLMIESLNDQYSVFMRPKAAESFQKQIQGELSGIGAKVERYKGGGVMIVSPLPGSPAIKAGVLPGDRITHVNGESIVDLDFQDAVEKIRGPVGSTAELTIERGGGKLIIPVVRYKIVIPEVTVQYQDGVAVIQITQFGTKVREKLTGLLEDVMKEKPQAILLDLRNNPGGLLDAAIDVIANFMPENAIAVRIKSKNDERIEAVPNNDRYVVPADMPIGVLVNGGSASASEIVAGALQDHGRATIFGRKTFGKGTVQQVVSFVSGESLKITIAEWLTPAGRSIDGKGIIPDVIIDDTAIGGRDEMLLEAVKILKRR